MIFKFIYIFYHKQNINIPPKKIKKNNDCLNMGHTHWDRDLVERKGIKSISKAKPQFKELIIQKER